MEADLILHVVDVSDPERLEKKRLCGTCSRRLAPAISADLRSTTSSICMGPHDPLPILKSNEFVVSAVTGQGLAELVERIVHEVGIRTEALQT